MSQQVTSLPPEECQTMAEVRAGVDAVDLALIELLSRRFGYMDAAARIKTERTDVRDDVRKAQVLDNVKLAAARNAVPVDVAASLWGHLVEASIAYEFEQWDAVRGN